MESLVTLALTGTESIKNRQTFFFIYIDIDTERYQLFILKKTKIFEYGEGDNTPPFLLFIHPLSKHPCSNYQKKQLHSGLFRWDTHCSGSTMGLLSLPEIKVLYRKVALAQWQCEDIKARCKYLRNRRTFSTFFKKSENFSTIFWKRGRGTFPTSSRSHRPRLGLPLDPRVCHAKFGCSSSYKDR